MFCCQIASLSLLSLLMSHQHRKYHGKKVLNQDQQFKRYQAMNKLTPYFPYLYQIQLLNDTVKYPTNLLDDLCFQLTYVIENPFETNPQLSQAYNDIYIQNQYLKSYYLQQQQLQQEQMYYIYQQQQQQQAEYGQQGYSPVNYSQGQSQRYGGQNINQYQQRQGHQAQGQYPRQNDRKYQNRQGQRNTQEGDRYGGQGHHHRGDRSGGQHGGYRKNFHQKGHTQPQHQKNFIQDEQETAIVPTPVQVQKVEEVKIQPEPVVVPKPEPKPVKFSISQIKEFINSFSKEDLQKHANPEVVEKTKEISSWKCEQVEVQMKEEPVKFQRKQSKRPQGGNYKQHAGIKTGVKKDEAKQAERLGYKAPQEKKLTIVVGAKQTLETRQMKQELKKKAYDFVGQKMQEDKGLNKVQKDRKEIVFNLNLIVPENLKDIEKDLVHFLYDNEEVCKILVVQTIKKAWDQPKYASTYARLCADFSKKPLADFKFEKKHKDNPFKTVLVESVQHSFDLKIEKFPIFESAEDKELFLKDFKKKILSNVKFIAELIICKVLKRRIIKYCVSQLFESFFKHYYAFIHDKKIEDSIYDYHYEGIIEFIENIGEKYDELDEKEKDKEHKPQYDFKQILDHIAAVLKVTEAPNNHILDCISSLSGQQYFQLLSFINETYMRKTFPRLGALLQNLVERKNNKWQKHLSVAEGPKKLKQIQEDIDNEEHQGREKHAKISKEKMEQEKLDKKVKEMYEGWQMGKNQEQRQMKEILKKHNEHDFYLALLKQVADEKKENVAKRVTLLPVIMDHDRFRAQEFKHAWIAAIKYLTIGGEDFPFCGAALAKVLAFAIERGGKLDQYHKKYEDEEQELFSEEVIHKYYFYTKDENALKIIKPKAKYSGLI